MKTWVEIGISITGKKMMFQVVPGVTNHFVRKFLRHPGNHFQQRRASFQFIPPYLPCSNVGEVVPSNTERAFVKKGPGVDGWGQSNQQNLDVF